MNETSGVLRPAVEDYLNGQPLSEGQIAVMRGYLRQWIVAPAWRGPEVEALRRDVGGISTEARLRRWIDAAIEIGIDPL